MPANQPSGSVTDTAQSVRWRQQKPVDFVANTPQTIKLRRGFVYRALFLELSGTVNITAAGTAAPTGSPDQIMRRIKLLMNGNNTIRSYDGPSLRELNRVWFNQTPLITTVDPTAAGAQSFKSYLCLPLWSPRTIKPFTTALDSSPLSQFELEVDWGDISDIVGDATATFTSDPIVKVKSLESFGAIPGGALWRSFVLSENVPGANSAMQVQLPVGQQYRQFLFRTSYLDGSNRKIYSDSVINNVKLISGATVYFDMTHDDLVGAEAMLDDILALPAGAYSVDLVTDGYLTEAPDTFGFSEFFLEFDLQPDAGGSTTLEIFPQQIVPVRAQSHHGSGG